MAYLTSTAAPTSTKRNNRRSIFSDDYNITENPSPLTYGSSGHMATQSMRVLPSPRRSFSPVAQSATASMKELYPAADIYERHFPGIPVQETIITSVEDPELESIIGSEGDYGNTSLIDSDEDFAEEEFPEELNEVYQNHYAQIEDLPINLRNLAKHPWMERCAYIDVFQEALDLYQMQEAQYAAIFESCLQAAYPLHPKVSQALSHFCSTMILFHPEAIGPNLHALIEFAVSGALIIKSEEETIAAIYQEVEPVLALETAINLLDEKPKTGFFAIQFIILVLQMAEDISLEKIYVSRACSYCLHQAKTPEEHRYAATLFSLFGKKMTEQYIAFVQSQPMEYTSQLAPYIQKSYPEAPWRIRAPFSTEGSAGPPGTAPLLSGYAEGIRDPRDSRRDRAP